jgi:hypothetical protein
MLPLPVRACATTCAIVARRFGQCGVVLLVVLLCAAASARADVYDDNLAAASRGAGDIVVLARGVDGAIYERHLAGGAWSSWASIGGSTSSGPAAAAYGDTIHAFVTGSDGAIYENVLRAGSWSGWTSLGGIGTSAPSASARRGTNMLDLAVRGTGNGLHFRTFQPGAGWSGWAALGGNLTSGPSVNSQDPGDVNIYFRGTDGQMVQKPWDGSRWLDWIYLGGSILGAPSAIARQENMVDVFARGINRALYQQHWQGGAGWRGWQLVDPKPMDSTPVAVSDTADHVVLFARSGGEVQYKDWTATGGWGAWTSWNPVAPPPPPPPPPPDGLAELVAGVRCTPPGGRLRVTLKVRARPGRPKPRVRKVVFFVKHGPRRVDRRAPFARRLRMRFPAGKRGRVYARATYTRKGSRKLRQTTVWRHFTMCA